MFIKLQNIIKDYKNICQNPDLKLLNFEKIKLLYTLQKTDNNAKKIIEKMEHFEKGIKNIESIDQIRNLYDTYSEGWVYLHLKDKFITTYNERQGKHRPSMPDFECSFSKSHLPSDLNFFIEVKTPNIKEFKKTQHKTKRKQ